MLAKLRHALILGMAAYRESRLICQAHCGATLPGLTSRLGLLCFTTPAHHGQPPLMLQLAHTGAEPLAELVNGAWRTRPCRAGQRTRTDRRPSWPSSGLNNIAYRKDPAYRMPP